MVISFSFNRVFDVKKPVYFYKIANIINNHALLLNRLKFYNSKKAFEANRGARAQTVTVNATGCGFDTHLRK